MPWCYPCDKYFNTQNGYSMHMEHNTAHKDLDWECEHMHSRIHAGADMQCPFCKRSFATASGVTIHLESGSCSSGLNRHKINDMVRRLDRNNVITRPMITMPGYDRVETIATSRAWNGSGFECYLCTKQFNSLHSLNNHLKSPAHEQKIYRCPNRQCGREYKLLSGLVQHVESESCGLMRFSQVQRQARNGIQNMVGKMITG
ncbi:hypothetical protein G7Y89_g7885 [Cudoniella acicularis]|uniref:C2H2-type domain-containing protein n=1 Tax=Cudoniella acicularis TaxID=354080 RepID=A0A8H4RJX8_9HELO|nr:hypothetical protein G7Y89_g7885 [Cudoniella acicularis]